ncbi:hypothetical protein J0910_00545 [Nocardiopsis sp. CNT-189]|uniref:hypothetical protein n=1 Tax=Nocardiopsis oceanisediminis TaxID=2816862 RepID=UPI003B378570
MKTIRKQRPRRRRAPEPDDDTVAAPVSRERTHAALDDTARVLALLTTTLESLKEH